MREVLKTRFSLTIKIEPNRFPIKIVGGGKEKKKYQPELV